MYEGTSTLVRELGSMMGIDPPERFNMRPPDNYRIPRFTQRHQLPLTKELSDESITLPRSLQSRRGQIGGLSLSKHLKLQHV